MILCNPLAILSKQAEALVFAIINTYPRRAGAS